jgi:hypothetical protein
MYTADHFLATSHLMADARDSSAQTSTLSSSSSCTFLRNVNNMCGMMALFSSLLCVCTHEVNMSWVSPCKSATRQTCINVSQFLDADWTGNTKWGYEIHYVHLLVWPVAWTVTALCEYCRTISGCHLTSHCLSRWPRGLRRGSAAVRLLGSWCSNSTGGMDVSLLLVLCVVR